MELSNLSLADNNDDSSIMSIYDLPEYAIREIIDYIPKTSRALLALALTTDSSSWREVHWCKSSPKSILTWFKKKKKKGSSSSSEEKYKRPSAITKIILSAKNAEEENLWEEIDLSDISEEYADGSCESPGDVVRLGSKLTDDDIAGMLACIDAVHKLKSLNLGNNCAPLIVGSALEPLRGSTILERLDLSLLGSIPNFELLRLRWCNLSETAVIPVLDSIIDRQNHRLRHLQFPREWRRDVHSVESGYLADFIEKYNDTEHQQSIHCKKCNVNCRESLSPVREDERFDGIQHFTCYDCLSHYCYLCKDDVENDFFLKFCDRCERWRCRDCEPMVACRCCTQRLDDDISRRNGSYMCHLCSEEQKCDICSHVFCRGCDEDGDGLLRCTGCDKWGCDDCMQMMFCEHDGCEVRVCLDCRQAGGENTLESCNKCWDTFCFKHRYESCKEDWDNCCAECLRMVAPMLVLPGVMEPSLLQG